MSDSKRLVLTNARRIILKFTAIN